MDIIIILLFILLCVLAFVCLIELEGKERIYAVIGFFTIAILLILPIITMVFLWRPSVVVSTEDVQSSNITVISDTGNIIDAKIPKACKFDFNQRVPAFVLFDRDITKTYNIPCIEINNNQIIKKEIEGIVISMEKP